MEITGKVIKIFDTQTFSSGFKKKEVIVNTEEQYPQPLSIEFLQDKTDIAENLQVGDNVKVSINLRGREWTSPDGITKYFNSIVGWRVEKINTQQVSGGNTPNDSSNQEMNNAQNFNSQVTDLSAEEDVDDLPF